MIARDLDINLSLVKAVDNLYLSMFLNRTTLKDSQNCTSHISKAIFNNRSEMKKKLAPYQLNEIEASVFEKLDQLFFFISSKKENGLRIIPRIINNNNDIRALLTRVSEVPTEMDLTYINVVLSSLGQFDYRADSLVLPNFMIHPNGLYCNKRLVKIDEVKFEMDRSESVIPSDVWYKMFRGFIFDSNVSQGTIFNKLFSTLNIDLLPDNNSGIYLSRFPLTSVFDSKVLSDYVISNGLYIFDDRMIRIELQKSNPNLGIPNRMIDNDNMQDGNTGFRSSALEAESDEVPENVEGEVSETSTDTTSNASEAEVSENPENPEEVKDQETSDTPLDTPGTENPGKDININKSKPILGLDIKLAKDETLDDYLYKLSITNYIDNSIEFNHDELPAETLTILKEWKNKFLFLASIEETEKLLKSLKIKLK